MRRRRGSRKSVLWVAVAVLLALGLAAIFWQRWRGDEGRGEPTARRPSQEVAAGPETGARPPSPPRGATKAAPGARVSPLSAEPLPTLEASDAFVRTAAKEISRHPSFASWLAQEDLVQLFVISVDNIAEGLSPRKHLAFLKPRGKFLVVGNEPDLRIDPSGYHRYDRIAEVVSSLDTEGCVELYSRLRPLIERSYHEMGYPGLDFDDRLGQAIAEMLAVPVAPEAPVLVEGVLRFEFADPDLEALSDAQKHLLRMGPRNAQLIQQKLRELAQALGIPAGE